MKKIFIFIAILGISQITIASGYFANLDDKSSGDPVLSNDDSMPNGYTRVNDLVFYTAAPQPAETATHAMNNRPAEPTQDVPQYETPRKRREKQEIERLRRQEEKTKRQSERQAKIAEDAADYKEALEKKASYARLYGNGAVEFFVKDIASRILCNPSGSTCHSAWHEATTAMETPPPSTLSPKSLARTQSRLNVGKQNLTSETDQD